MKFAEGLKTGTSYSSGAVRILPEWFFALSPGCTVARPVEASKETMFPGITAWSEDRMSRFRFSKDSRKKVSLISM